MQLVSYLINKEADRTTRDSGYRQRARAALPSSSLSLSEASLLSTFRDADCARAVECGHVPFSSESTEGHTEKDREEQESDRPEEEESQREKGP